MMSQALCWYIACLTDNKAPLIKVFLLRSISVQLYAQSSGKEKTEEGTETEAEREAEN